ncbi:RagB/SusD family nutrient uptake outer membrane protein [Mucilaginibacter jinjuensis]|uniref:RagB/SusD family nutrient uptake outer membrane protein n=1 Tax=Mucilaginibacter jinjuensis TaxID=1176721 RepID=A0ABY7T5A0_9SPHI|nr:RagB/SusD family nutrient uptake outer membrane protein [Mucilaginibacter jinjuensis]WCT10432.1 RagB/SusD family nutrient uptake outer membrane protein [Mucilaginibacter jinjuensis]
MKNLKHTIITIAATVALASCHKLEVAPKNIITDEAVFSTPTGVTAYLASIYSRLPMEDFIYRNDGGYDPNNEGNNGGFSYLDGGRWQCFYNPGSLSGELVGPYGGTGDAAQGFGYWPYKWVRNINYFIENLPKGGQGITDAQKNQLLGEAYFLRAYFYFAMVKRYGGIPIIKTVQDPQGSLESLQVHRDKEIDVYNFIADDLDKAYSMMPESNDRGRANKYVAAALKSRAMLYAGSIAKYGSVNFVAGPAQTAGYTGIPASEANGFFQKSVDAAKLLDGHYQLYNKVGDKEQNYVQAFLDQDSPENIFVRDYSVPSGTAHSYDATFSPRYMTADGDSRAYPTIEDVERYTTLKVTNADGTPIRFNSLADIMAGLEPRLKASIYFPGATLRGLTFDVQRGLYDHFSGTAAAEIGLTPPNHQYQHLAGSTDALYNGLRIIGFTGISTDGDNKTRTGFFVRKYVAYNKLQSDCGLYKSTQSWIDIRYAEVLLNRAEASFELGQTADALNMINQIRTRAGATLSTGGMTIDTIRNERCKELAFEKHYWWDLRRWHTADKVLDNTKFHALLPYYVIDEKKYIFIRDVETFQRTYTFDKKWYYEPIPGGELGKNPNLYPNNPGY